MEDSESSHRKKRLSLIEVLFFGFLFLVASLFIGFCFSSVFGDLSSRIFRLESQYNNYMELQHRIEVLEAWIYSEEVDE